MRHIKRHFPDRRIDSVGEVNKILSKKKIGNISICDIKGYIAVRTEYDESENVTDKSYRYGIDLIELEYTRGNRDCHIDAYAFPEETDSFEIEWRNEHPDRVITEVIQENYTFGVSYVVLNLSKEK